MENKGFGMTAHGTTNRDHTAVTGRTRWRSQSGVGEGRNFFKFLATLSLIMSLNKQKHQLKRDMYHFLHAMKYKSTGAGSGVQQRFAEAEILM